MTIPNTFGTEGNYIGTAPLGFNQYMASPDVAPSLVPYVWSPAVITFYTLLILQGIVDHIHYLVGHSGVEPTLDEMAGAPIWNSDVLVLTLPEAHDNMVYMVAHDVFHRPTDREIRGYGEYWVDQTAPVGTLLLNEGDSQSSARNVDMHLIASDNLSGIAEVFIDGDLDPADPHWRHWTPYSEHTDVLLAEVEGKKTVTCRLRDEAGNVSETFYGTIIYPMLRYFFNKLPGSNNRLESNNPMFTVQTDNRFAQKGNTMKEGADYGKFTSN